MRATNDAPRTWVPEAKCDPLQVSFKELNGVKEAQRVRMILTPLLAALRTQLARDKSRL